MKCVRATLAFIVFISICVCVLLYVIVSSYDTMGLLHSGSFFIISMCIYVCPKAGRQVDVEGSPSEYETPVQLKECTALIICELKC